MKKGMNKKGAELAIGTIVVIILALVVLVVLIYGFTVGWGNLFQNILGFGGGQVNVQTVVSSCQISCSTQGVYDYCTKKRNVVFEEGKKGELLTCDDLERRNVGLESCASVDCVIAEEGICSGSPSPSYCSSLNNDGRLKCESLEACKWVDNPDNPNEKIGNCELKEEVVCENYNNNRLVCEGLGCTWTAV